MNRWPPPEILQLLAAGNRVADVAGAGRGKATLHLFAGLFFQIAEQVEDQPSFDSLRELGVNFIQGNFVEAPRGLGSAG